MTRRKKRIKPSPSNQKPVAPKPAAVDDSPKPAAPNQYGGKLKEAAIDDSPKPAAPKPAAIPDFLIDGAKVKELLGISESTFRRMIKAKQLPGHLKVRGRHKFNAAAIIAMIRDAG